MDTNGHLYGHQKTLGKEYTCFPSKVKLKISQFCDGIQLDESGVGFSEILKVESEKRLV